MSAGFLDRWPDLDEVLEAALELEGAARAAFLEDRCASDPELREEIDRLLEAHEASVRFLEEPRSWFPVPEFEPIVSLAAGDRLGQYLVTEMLGEGGLGEVWRADDTVLRRTVAIKVLKLTAGPEQDRRALLREARSVSKLNHPNICSVYEVGEAGGKTFVAMEHVEGKTLAELIPDGGLPVESAISYGRQVAEGLAWAHEHGVIHRDLKAANVVVTSRGLAKVLDFGIAKEIGGEQIQEATRSVAPLSGGTGFAGTIPYMAPEALVEQEADARADIWSLGVLLYEMAAGRRPFEGTTSAELVASILRDEPEPLPERVPPSVRKIIRRSLVKEPERRYQRASEVSASLEALDELQAVGVATSPNRLRRGLLHGAAAVLLVAAAAALGRWILPGSSSGADGSGVSSIAVLPLENLSGDPQQEFFSDGMTDELITELARAGTLRVTSRTSTMVFKGGATPLPQIASALGVDAVLEGTVRRADDRIRVTANLVDGATDRSLWNGSYEGELSDVLRLQREVATAIIAELRGALAEEADPQPEAAIVAPQAHEAYLWGRFYWNRRTESDLLIARDYFQTAIAAQPDYAAAHAGLADTHTMLGVYGTQPALEAAEVAKQSARRALELDPASAQGYKALGYTFFAFDWDWDRAGEALLRARDLNPSDSGIRNWYSSYLMVTGRLDEALTEITEARALDPLSPIVVTGIGLVHMTARRYEESAAVFEELLSNAPDFRPARLYLSRVRILQGRIDDGIRELETLVESNGSAEQTAELAAAYALAGREAEALEILDGLRDPPDSGLVSLALAWLRLGDTDAAVRWLTEAYERRSLQLITLGAPHLDPLRADPRTNELVRRMAFPQG